MTELSHAVFLSYASQDAQAAQRICEALRVAGIEVWLDQSELRGGEVWDRKIRAEIHDCALFIPVISQHTQERLEGYFRLEWKLAVDRSHLMAIERPFLVPIVVDATRETDAVVPDAFKAVQWTRLPNGETSSAFVERVQRLLSQDPSTTIRATAAGPGPAGVMQTPLQTVRSPKRGVLAAVAALILGTVAYLTIEKPWTSSSAPPPAMTAPAAPAGFNPPPHSIAVLPFVNMSGDKEQQYFSDGLTEELLNSLSRIEQLQVAASTSSFSFQGEHPDIATVAHKLNVGAVLEGSVRRAGNTVRITAQLINAVTGFHLWSQSYDRDLRDVLKLQTEIATAVASALKVALLGDETAKIELGGTRNPAAFDAYLRGSKTFNSNRSAQSLQSAIAAFTDAIRLDPNYALAFAARSQAHSVYASNYASDTAVREFFDKAQVDAYEATRLAPELAEGHLALAVFLDLGAFDFAHASEEYERAAALAPGNAQVLAGGSRFAAYMGRFDAAIAASRRAVALDPLNPQSHNRFGQALYIARRYQEAISPLGEAVSLDPDFKSAYGFRGLAYYGLRDFENARSLCESKPDHWVSQQCLAVVYDKLGRHADAEAELAKLRSANGNGAAYQYATIYAQWGDRAKALEWLDVALRVRDPGLVNLKTDALMDPLRQEPRFEAMVRELKFPAP